MNPYDQWTYLDYRTWEQIAAVEGCVIIILCAVIACLLVKREKHG
jgi:hypothetical protein